MRRLITLGFLSMSLFGCLFGKSPSLKKADTLPKGASYIVYDDGQGLVAVDGASGVAYRWSPRASTADALRGTPHAQLGATVLARDGLSLTLPLPAGAREPSVSPDLRQFVFTRPGQGSASSVERMAVDGSDNLSLTSGGSAPSFLADGTVGLRGGDQVSGSAIYRVNADGSGLSTVVETPGRSVSYLEWSPDGTRVAYSVTGAETPARIEVASLDGAGATPIIDVAGATATRPRWSPDGAWIAALVKLPVDKSLTAPATLWVADARTGQGAALMDLPAKEPSMTTRGGYKGARELAWSPDGQTIAFFAAMAGDCNQNTSGELICRHDLYIINRDGSGMKRLVKAQLTQPRALAWLP